MKCEASCTSTRISLAHTNQNDNNIEKKRKKNPLDYISCKFSHFGKWKMGIFSSIGWRERSTSELYIVKYVLSDTYERFDPQSKHYFHKFISFFYFLGFFGYVNDNFWMKKWKNFFFWINKIHLTYTLKRKFKQRRHWEDCQK